MALKAGRVGVRPDQVDPYGKIKSGGGAKITDFEDSEEIVFSSAGTKIKSFLHQSISNKIARALLLPVQTPTEKKIVGIDTSNSEILTGYSAADAGKVLAVSETGDLEWTEQQGGLYAVNGIKKKIAVESTTATVFAERMNNETLVFPIPEAAEYIFNVYISGGSGYQYMILGICNEPEAGKDKGTIAARQSINLLNGNYTSRIGANTSYIYASFYGVDLDGLSIRAVATKLEEIE